LNQLLAQLLSLPPPLLLLLFVASLAFAGWLTLAVRRQSAAYKLQRRAQRGREGESRAEGLLKKAGYTVLDAQVTRDTGIIVNGTLRPVKVRADLLVEKGGQTFVVEVKTGSVAPDPASAATRRQLLEYHYAFDVDGLLLADMERNELLTIGFEHDAAEQSAEDGDYNPFRSGLLLGFISGILLAVSVMAWWR